MQKLEAQPISESPDTVRLPSGWMDVPRTLALWKTYGGAKQVVREGRWSDRPSVDIPLFYALVARDLGDALHARGQRAEAEAVIALGSRVVEAVR